MTRCHLLLCLWAALLWAVAEGRPSSVEQLPDGTDVMLSSMGLVEGADQQHELDQVPHPGWRQSAAGPVIQIPSSFDTDTISEESAVLRQLIQRLLPSAAPIQPPRQRRSGTSTTGTTGTTGTNGMSDTQHQQLTRQLLRRFKELQKRSYPYKSDLFRQARGYMCLSKVCNFKGARGK